MLNNINHTQITPTDIINFWFSSRIKTQWFNATPELDREIQDSYEQLWEFAISGKLEQWRTTPQGSLALVIVLDQFPLNMFRGEAKSFSSEQLAVTVARNAITSGQDTQLEPSMRSFLYMPFMHSENMDDQNLAVELYTKAGLTDNITFAKHHQNIVHTYGRFPHRNKILSRTSTAEELEYLQSENAFLG